MSTITTRAGKGSPLTNTEVDNNFTNLNTDKAELSGATFTGNISLASADLQIGNTTAIDSSRNFDANQLVVNNPTGVGHMQMGTISNTNANGYVRSSILMQRGEDQITWDSTSSEWTHAGGSSTDWSMIAHKSSGLYVWSGPAVASSTTYTNTAFDTNYLALKIDSQQNSFFYGSLDVASDLSTKSLIVSHVPTGAASGIVYPVVIETDDTGNQNDYVVGDGVGLKFKIGTNDVGSPAEQSQVGASIAAIREVSSDTATNTGLGFFVSNNDETLDEALRIDNLGNADFKTGNIEMGGTAFVTQARDVTANKINIVSSETNALKLTITDDVANRDRNAMHIDFNLSGADDLTVDRTKAGLKIDVDSTATGGGTSHEHRVYGIYNDVRASGDSDLIYGQYNYVEAQLAAGQTSAIYGDFSNVIVDETSSGRTAAATAVYGNVNVQSSGTGDATGNTYGGYFKSLCSTAQEKNIDNMHGMMAEVEIDNTANGVTVDNAYVVRSYYDNDVISTGDVVVANSFLFHGSYTGALPSNPYGVFISTDVPNYFRGNVDVRGSDGLEVKNASDTHLKVQTRTDLASDYGMTRFYGKDAGEVGFVIGYGSSHSSSAHQIALKASNAAGTVGLYTNGTERVHIANTRTTVTNPMVVNPATDVSLTSTTHAFQIGAVGSGNMRFDPNEIMCIDADGTSVDLRLQHGGGRVLVNNDLMFEGHKIFTNGNTMDFSVDDNTGGSNQQFRWSEGGVVRMVLEDNDLYVHDNINAGRKYESGASNIVFETGSSHVSSYSADAVNGESQTYRTFIQSTNSTDPDLAVFQCFSKDVMADTGITAHGQKSTAHLLDNGGRVWSWNSQYAGRVRVGSTATTTAYRAADNAFTAYSGTGNAHGATTSAGYTLIAGRETANTEDVFSASSAGQMRIEFDAIGNGYFDGGADLGNADYAEYFEWADGNPDNEDRRGYSVVLTTDGKMRIATSDDDTADFLGIVSVEAAIVGDSAWAAWTGKYERDRFGQKVFEDYDLLCWGPYDEDAKSYKTQTTLQAMIDAGREADIPEDAITVTKRRLKLSANYDPDRDYTARKDRIEWQAIGLMGKLPLIKGQPTAPQWRKLFDLNDEVEMWLVR